LGAPSINQDGLLLLLLLVVVALLLVVVVVLLLLLLLLLGVRVRRALLLLLLLLPRRRRPLVVVAVVVMMGSHRLPHGHVHGPLSQRRVWEAADVLLLLLLLLLVSVVVERLPVVRPLLSIQVPRKVSVPQESLRIISRLVLPIQPALPHAAAIPQHVAHVLGGAGWVVGVAPPAAAAAAAAAAAMPVVVVAHLVVVDSD
jgi:hypothetical protein